MEEQSLMSDSKSNGNQSHLNEVLSVPKVNGNYVEKIDKDSADNEDKSTLENNLVEQGKGLSIFILLFLYKCYFMNCLIL
jgi:hypothetical protein